MFFERKGYLFDDFMIVPLFNPIASDGDIVANFTNQQLFAEDSDAAKEPAKVVEFSFLAVLIAGCYLEIIHLQICE
jgi:hypothetical protein